MSAVITIQLLLCRCNDSHSLQRHKVNRHRFPMKKPVRKISLPSMVGLQSVEEFSNNNVLINNLLEQQQRIVSALPREANSHLISEPSSTCSSDVSVHSTSSLSSIGQMMLQHKQQNLQLSSNVKLRSIRSVSDSFSPPFCHRLSSSENDSVIDLVDESEKTNKLTSVSPVESIPVTVKEEVSCDGDSPKFSLQKTPTSHSAFDYLHGNRSSMEPASSKSPLSVEKQCSLNSQEQRNSPVFEDRPTTPEFLPATTNKKADAASQSLTQSSNSWKCAHCDIIFPDNIMYGLHMGCHSVSIPFQCNICGMKCKNSHDFMFHFTIGKHLQ